MVQANHDRLEKSDTRNTPALFFSGRLEETRKKVNGN